MYKITKEYEPVKVAELEFGEQSQERRLAKAFGEMVLTESREETFWESLTTGVRRGVKSLVEECLKEEMRVQIGVDPYQQSHDRTGYRSGYYTRDLVSSFGLIERILVPKQRKKKKQKFWGFKVFKRYGRRVEEIDELIKDIFLAGVSTRRVEGVIKPLLGTTFSAQCVSNVLRQLDQEVRQFHNRPLQDHYVYLFFDGITLKIRHNGKVHKKRVLVAYGITPEGKREMIDYAFAKGESQIAWECFIQHLYVGGLKGTNLRLIVTDGNQGLLNALDLVYPRVHKQRCWAHRMRNAANRCPRKVQALFVSDAHKICYAQSKPEARKAFQKLYQTWHGIVPEAVQCIQGSLEELLYFFDCPKELWVKLRTTNVIERSFREVRRRVRTISVFTNVESCDRIVFGVFSYLNHKWEECPLKIFAKLS
jgi:transposase-like protein